MPILMPSQTWQIIPAQQLSSIQGRRALIVGQQSSAATATSGVLQRSLELNAEDTLFGSDSILAEMVRSFREINKVTDLDVLPIDDNGSATAATASIAFTGTATAAGTYYVTFGSAYSYRVKIDVSVGDAAADIASAIDDAFDAITKKPFTTDDSTNTVTATAVNGGTLANTWCTKVEGTVAGLTYVITNWASGATDPTLTSILDVIENIRYTVVVYPEVFALTDIEALLNARFNASYRIMDGMVIQTKKGTAAEVAAYASQNSQSVVVIGNKTVSQDDRKGAAIMEFNDVISSQVAAFKALKLTENAPLANYLSTVATSDQFGGMALASLPYFNTKMPYMPVPDARDEFTLAEQATLETSGVSVIGPNRAYNETILGPFVTTYLTNGAGNDDTSYKYVEVVETASIIREYFYENMRSRYAQTRLTDGDLIAGRDMANEASIRAFCHRLYDELADDALVQAGRAAKKDFDQNLTISVNMATGTVTVAMAPLLVTQLRVILGTIQINFG